MRIRIIALLLTLGGLIGGLIGVSAYQVIDEGDGNGGTTVATSDDGTPSTENEESPQQTSLATDCLSAADVYEQVRPAVVEITSISGAGPFGQQAQGTGTGMVIDSDGHILTNNHVVEGAQSLEVRFADGSTVSATLVGSDAANDLAVIDVDVSAGDLTVAKLGDSDALRVGDPVLAIGNPFNLEGTLTQGIVSALDRTYSTGGSTRPLRGLVQTDAAVNPGNSGGPLLNCRGEAVGINTLLENPTGSNVNVGVAFAVAINTAKQSLPQVLSGVTVSHPWLGIAGTDVTPALADSLGLDTDRGVYVTLVSQGSPADDAGLQGAFQSENAAQNSDEVPPGGDVILSVDGHDVSSIEDLAGYLDENYQPGDSVNLTVLRDGTEITVTAQLAEWPS